MEAIADLGRREGTSQRPSHDPKAQVDGVAGPVSATVSLVFIGGRGFEMFPPAVRLLGWSEDTDTHGINGHVPDTTSLGLP